MQTNIDDHSAELIAYSTEKILASGLALDCWLESIQMKKGRAAVQLNALCQPGHKDALLTIIFSETGTIGIRIIPVQRASLRRIQREVETSYGRVTAKASYLGEKLCTVKPEYEDCRRLAEAHDIPLKTILTEANSILREQEVNREYKERE